MPQFDTPGGLGWVGASRARMHAVKGMPRSMYYFARRGPVVRNEGQNLTGTRREREGSDELEVRQHIRACHHPLEGRAACSVCGTRMSR